MMKNKWKKVLAGALVAVVAVAVPVVAVFTSNASAKKDVNINNSYVQKMILTSVGECIWHQNVMASTVNTEFITDSDQTVLPQMFNKSSTTEVPLPSFATNMKESKVTCYNLMTGDRAWFGTGKGTFPGVLGLFGINSMTVRDQLDLFGFTPEMGVSGEVTQSIVFSDGAGHESQSDAVTIVKDPSTGNLTISVEQDFGMGIAGECAGSVYNDNMLNITQSGSEYTIRFNDMICQKYDGTIYVPATLDMPDLPLEEWRKWTLTGVPFTFAGNDAGAFFTTLQDAIRQMTNGKPIVYTTTNIGDRIAGAQNYSTSYTMQESTVQTTSTGNWNLTKSLTSVMQDVIHRLSNGQYYWGSLTFTPKEALDYYVAQLTQHYFEDVNVSSYWICDDTITTSDTKIAIDLMPTTGSSFERPANSQTCKIDTGYANADNKNDSLNALSEPRIGMNEDGDSFTYFDFKTLGEGSWRQITSIKDLIEEINKIAAIALEVGDTTTITEDVTDATKPSADPSKECYNAGIDSVAWVLCPAISNMTSTSDGIDALLASMLAVDTNLYSDSSGAGQVWGYFRDFANIALVIIFLVVVVSQLTGYGIDNYGIKKILPRLVVMAILINLSFFICQLAVDISNILGSGLTDLLKGIGMSVYKGYTVGQFFTTIVGGLLTIAAGAGAAAGIAAPVIGAAISGTIGPMIIISLVLSLLVALVAILFFFVMVGARMIIVIVCVAIAPIAFVCYILPNTQSLFKRWWDVFKAALVIYPICGLLYGLSFIIRGMVFPHTTAEAEGASTPFILALIAVFAPYVPFLVLPTLLRGALSAIGSIGGAISTLGSTVRRGLGNANARIRETGAYRAESEMQRRGMTRWRAALDADGKPLDVSKMSRWGKAWRGGEHGIAQARRQAARDMVDTGEEQGMMGAGAEAAIAAAEEKVSANNVAAAQSLIEMGRAKLNNGGLVNSNDAASVGQYHREALARYQRASSQREKDDYLSQIKAAQNVLMRTDKGRAQMVGNISGASSEARSVADFAGLRLAASHVMDNYGDKLKAVNRGGHALMADLSTAAKDKDYDAIKRRIAGADSTAYAAVGTNKYDPNSLVGADDAALDGLISSLGVMNPEQLKDITGTASGALAMQQAGRLGIKPEVATKIRTIAGYQAPGAADASSGGRGVEDTSVSLRGEGGATGGGAASAGTAGTNEEFWNNSGNNTAQE